MTDFTTASLLAKAANYPKQDALPRHTSEGQQLAVMAADAHNIVGKHDIVARRDAHMKLAQQHRDVAAAFKASGHPDLATLNMHAADLHDHAASENNGEDGLNARGATQAAVDATADANSAVMANQNPVSGVMNGTSIASGTVTKGDVKGHELHGNQWEPAVGASITVHHPNGSSFHHVITSVSPRKFTARMGSNPNAPEREYTKRRDGSWQIKGGESSSYVTPGNTANNGAGFGID